MALPKGQEVAMDEATEDIGTRGYSPRRNWMLECGQHY